MKFTDIKWCSVNSWAEPHNLKFISNNVVEIGKSIQKDMKTADISAIHSCDALILWGGPDMHPSYYDQTKHPHSHAGSTPLNRDIYEWEVLQYATHLKKPIVGICLGAQRLWAFNKGTLWQDISGHTTNHQIIVNVESTELNIYAAGNHHQAFRIAKNMPHFEVLGESYCGHDYEGENTDDVPKSDVKEIEIAFFPENKHLCIQGHPEWMSINADFPRICRHYIEKLL